MAATGTFFFVGSKKDFALGAWKHDRALIAAFRDDIHPVGRRPLPTHQLLPHGRVVGRVVDGGGNFEFSDCGRDIPTIEQDAVPLKFDADLANEWSHGFGDGQSNTAFPGSQRHRAIHRTRIQKTVAQPPRTLAGCAALAGSGGSVDGNNHGKGNGAVDNWQLARSPFRFELEPVTGTHAYPGYATCD